MKSVNKVQNPIVTGPQILNIERTSSNMDFVVNNGPKTNVTIDNGRFDDFRDYKI